MENKKAFTLVELLAVITILAIILAIVVPKAFRSIQDSKKRACKIQLDYIEEGAATYFAKYRYKKVNGYKDESGNDMTYDQASKVTTCDADGKNCEVVGVDITLEQIISAGILKGKIINPLSDGKDANGNEVSKEFPVDTTIVNIANDDGSLVYNLKTCDAQKGCAPLVCE